MRDHEVNCTLSQEDRKISPSVKLGVNVVNSICRMRQKRSSPHMSQVPIRPKLILADLVSVAWTIKLLPHCYCASLVRTLFIRHALPRHVFQARAPSRNSTKYRADDLCVNFGCEYFCWMLGDPHFFFGRSVPFLSLSIILKKKKMYVGSFNYSSFYYSHKVGFVHGYRCAWLRNRIF